MAKRGTKIKDLAQELGMTSRAMLERCRAEGMAVQNSITRVDADTERRIRGWFQTTGDVAAGTSAPRPDRPLRST